jgi:hypothetical protein
MSPQPELKGLLPGATPSSVAEAPPDREVRNRFYRYALHLGVPLTVSLAVHGILLILLAFKTFQVISQPKVDIGEYSASLTESLADQMKDAFTWTQGMPLPTPDEPAPLEALDTLTNPLREMPSLSERELAGDTPGLGGDGAGGDLGIGDGALSLLGTGSGAGEAGTGGLGEGLGGGSARMGVAGIWDLNIRANKVVYVVDYSGSIIVAVDELKRELKRSVGRLKPSQSFNVILFYSRSDEVKIESFKPKLEAATDELRKEFFAWIDRRAPQGDTQPVEAMRRALALQPDAIFLFSDGMFGDPQRDAAQINHANAGKLTRVYCLVFDELLLADKSDLPRETDGSRLLREIAEANGGKCKIVTARDLGR